MLALMARPTTWRRSFNVAGFTDPLASVDLLTVQPNETLGAVWWQYSLRSIGNVPTNAQPPLDNVVPIVGLILVDSASGQVTPLTNLTADWLWWEMATFNHTLVNNIDFAYMNASNTGGDQRKAKGMRKNDSGVDMTLKAAFETYDPIGSQAQASFSFQVACSALIILP